MGSASSAQRLLVVIAVVATGLGLAASPAAAAPSLTVTPATGLLDQQIVTVTGSGFDPHDRVIVAQCPGATLEGCVLNPPINTTAAYATAGSDGAFSTSIRLSRVLGGNVSCAEAACSIVAVAIFGGLAERARTTIDFATTGTAPAPPDATLAISAPDMRANGASTATWSGSGYLPWFETTWYALGRPSVLDVLEFFGNGRGAYLALCAPAPSGWAGCERFLGPEVGLSHWGTSVPTHEVVGVRPDGTVSEPRGLPRILDSRSGRIDCAIEDCSFALEQDGAPHSNVVDVDWAPEWSPWPSARAFVVEAYVALVGRVPTPSERSAAIDALTDRSLTGFTFLRQLADSRRLAELTRLYQAALGRRPDADGLRYWASELHRSGSMSAIAVALGRSPEFRRAFGPSANDFEAVHRAYLLTLGREPSVAEYAYWVGRLENGLARTHMIHLFSRTPEFVAREAGRSEVAAVTVPLLRRGPTPDEWPSAVGRHDTRTLSERIDDGVLAVLSSDQLTAEVG